MQLPRNMVRCGNVLWINKRVPADVKAAFGADFVREPLKEGDPKQALAIGHRRLAELEEQWTAIRRSDPPDADRSRIAGELKQSFLDEDRAIRARMPAPRELALANEIIADIPDDPMEGLMQLGANADWLMIQGASSYDENRRAVLLTELQAHLRSGETALIDWAAEDAIRRGKLQSECPEGRRGLCQALRVTDGRLDRGPSILQAERDKGRPDAPTDDPSPVPSVDLGTDDETIMLRFEAYAAANPKGITPDSINLNRQVVRTLAGFLPKGFAASKLTKREVRAWQDAMRLMPIKAADSREFLT